MFVQINILEGSWLCSLNGSHFSHYFIFILLSDNSKIYQWKQFYWEFSFIKIQYVGTERETNLIINNKCTCSEEVSWPVLQKCKQLCVNCSMQRKRSNGNLVFIFSCLIDMNKFFEKHHYWKTSLLLVDMTFETCLLFMRCWLWFQ